MWNPGLKKPYFRFNTYILDIGSIYFAHKTSGQVSTVSTVPGT